MTRHIAYDITRLLTRILNLTPNGIDRIDHALASHVLSPTSRHSETLASSGVVTTGMGPRQLDGSLAAALLEAVAAGWGETGLAVEDDQSYRRVVAFLSGETVATTAPKSRAVRVPARVKTVAALIRRHPGPLTHAAAERLPPGSVYLNVSQFPLWWAKPFRWLGRRPDIRAAFFIHDLLPLQFPAYFPYGEAARHRRRLETFARFGSAAVVTTQTVAADLETHLKSVSRGPCPILVAPTPVAPVFGEPRRIDKALGAHPFFILCSTLEPRKNHLTILAAWCALVRRLGTKAPKLILVGRRAWGHKPIVDTIRRNPELAGVVLVVSGLSTPALKRLIDNAQALLMPSFGEGYGLPVHEALAAGAPVLASDIPVFREIRSERLELLPSSDHDAWVESIAQRSERLRGEDDPTPRSESSQDYFERLDAFLLSL